MLWWPFYIKLVLSHRFIALSSHNQSIKTYPQIENHFKEVLQHFSSSSHENALAETINSEVFMILDNKQLAAFLLVRRDKCYSQRQRKAFDFLGFFFCLVTEKYRGLGLSYEIMKKSIEHLKKTYNLEDDTVLALHVSPFDKLMPVATRVYYRMGFKQGMFITREPKEMLYRLDELVEYSRNMLDVARDEAVGHGNGYYFILYCRLKDFNQESPKDKDFSQESPKNKEFNPESPKEDDILDGAGRLHKILIQRKKLIFGE